MGTVGALVGRMRGMFFLSHHPWVGVVVLAILVAVVLATNKSRR
jgi:hypothetical protein